MFSLIRNKEFKNGVVYALMTSDGYPLEVTDTFLPFYTKDAIGRKQNGLTSDDTGSRAERWMIGVSVMSGCPVRCKFCATGKLKRYRNLTAQEIVEQVQYVINKNIGTDPSKSMEFKINYTRMGEPFLNIEAVKEAIRIITALYPNVHHYISTIGVSGSDFNFVKDNITLQFSIHSFDEAYRNWLIPFKRKMNLEAMGQVRTLSRLKTTLNLTLVRPEDFDIVMLKKYFDKTVFFVKLSPINTNDISNGNELGTGVIEQQNLI